jgi:hypothetical protein
MEEAVGVAGIVRSFDRTLICDGPRGLIVLDGPRNHTLCQHNKETQKELVYFWPIMVMNDHWPVMYGEQWMSECIQSIGRR